MNQENILGAPLGEVLTSKGNHGKLKFDFIHSDNFIDWRDPYKGSNTGSNINVPLNESQLRQHRMDQYFDREAEASKFNDVKLKEDEMAPKASGSNHWHMTEEPEEKPDAKPAYKPNPQFFTNPNVIDLVESSDDDLEVLSTTRKPFVMDLTVDEENFKMRRSNIFNSTVAQRVEVVNQSFEKPKPKQLSRLVSEVDDEVESLNESVEAMEVDNSDYDALVINESPQRSLVRTPEAKKPTQPFVTPGRVKQSDFKMANVPLDSSSSSLERSLDVTKEISEVISETLDSEDEEMETNPNSSENLFDQSESVQSSQPLSEPAQTPSTKFRRRSQLPVRPETRDDSADAEIEDFNGSIVMSG